MPGRGEAAVGGHDDARAVEHRGRAGLRGDQVVGVAQVGGVHRRDGAPRAPGERPSQQRGGPARGGSLHEDEHAAVDRRKGEDRAGGRRVEGPMAPAVGRLPKPVAKDEAVRRRRKAHSPDRVRAHSTARGRGVRSAPPERPSSGRGRSCARRPCRRRGRCRARTPRWPRRRSPRLP